MCKALQAGLMEKLMISIMNTHNDFTANYTHKKEKHQQHTGNTKKKVYFEWVHYK